MKETEVNRRQKGFLDSSSEYAHPVHMISDSPKIPYTPHHSPSGIKSRACHKLLRFDSSSMETTLAQCCIGLRV